MIFFRFFMSHIKPLQRNDYCSTFFCILSNYVVKSLIGAMITSVVFIFPRPLVWPLNNQKKKMTSLLQEKLIH